MSQCPQCGYNHPPVPPGECPIAKDRALKEDIKKLSSEKIQALYQAMGIKFMEKVKTFDKEKAEKFAADVFLYIEGYK